ncbi:MAG: RNA polymerase sigma factor [Faecousia sp.]
MEDSMIVELYWQRSEQAICETQKKYDGYCFSIAHNILPSREDAAECVNDTYLAAWNAMPPNRPGILSAFLGKLTRRLSIDRWRKLSAAKRGGGTITLALEELEQCVSGGADPAVEVERKELVRSVQRFLDGLSPQERKVFLLRYFDMAQIHAIAAKCTMSTPKVKSMLHRMRGKLRNHLQKEGLL